ncbi:hypothetical protein GTP41_01835 [Pseudoduganella sp. DS3]|uniref:SMI1/KNR4 family protein n=1 Tax=Pseudoduganella guangdongensis TaxID=2692179 RepID=A0A6N9HBB1_9BURK|nr:hypothetical protein [Pseudoduganella guangdongensis]MYN00831.1 hypothetical protein [Pseudoduganella guangdongensis]
MSWREQGIPLLPGLDIEEIRSLAKMGHISLSADVELLYFLCGGMPRGTVDGNWFELWPLERLLHDAKNFPYSLLPFAEGFLSAQLYCLRFEDASSASVHMDFSFDGNSTNEVAPSLDAMCGMLLEDPSALCLP